MNVNKMTLRDWVTGAVITGLALVPLVVSLTDNAFFLDLATRFVILAIAAISLNLILGYGRMISFGHAAYLGIGGYTIAILSDAGIDNGFIQWPIGIAASALAALIIDQVERPAGD